MYGILITLLVIFVMAVVVLFGAAGYPTPSKGIICASPSVRPLQETCYVETVADVYPGRLLRKGTNDRDVKVGSVGYAPVGWTGYESTVAKYRPATRGTIYKVYDWLTVEKGGGFVLLGKMAAGFYGDRGDIIVPWGTAGEVAPAISSDGDTATIKIPFSKQASEADTTIDLASGMVTLGCEIDVTTEVAGSHIDVGLGNGTEAGHDADGLLNGVACTAAGRIGGAPTVTTGTNEVYISASTLGAYLVDTFTAGTDAATDVGTYVPKSLLCDGTLVSISYTTSAHAVAGYILLTVKMTGMEAVGKLEETVDATAAATNCKVRSYL